MILECKLLHPDAQVPRKAYPLEDAGFDLRLVESVLVPPGEGVDVKTGLAVAIPTGWYGRIVGRSSALRKRGLLVVEGTIDSGYRGELFSYVFNLGLDSKEFIHLEAGESIAQLIVLPVPSIDWQVVDDLVPSARGEGGFGSTGR